MIIFVRKYFKSFYLHLYMKKIGLLSDTHGFLDLRMLDFFENCDEIWHTGDIGNNGVSEQLSAFKPVKAVYGNMDDYDIRSQYPKFLRFFCEEVDVLMTHIGGYPGRYEPEALKMIKAGAPQLFLCGHSHILKVGHDAQYGLLHINPGAAGNSGFHLVKTAVRFTIDQKDIRELEILELPRETTLK